MKISIKKVLVFVIMAAMVTVIANAMAIAADERTIQGDFAFTGQGACIMSPGGFDPTNLNPIGPWSYNIHTVSGIRTFNSDGTGIVKGRMMSTGFNNMDYSTAGVGSADIEVSFTYVLESDGTISTEFSSPLTGVYLTGPAAGGTFTIDQMIFKGMVTKDKNSMTLTQNDPLIETQVLPDGSNRYGLCHRSRVLFRIESKE